MASAFNKDDIIALEEVRTTDVTDEKDDGKIQVDEHGFQEEAKELGMSYFLTPSFIGSFLAIGLGFWAGNAGLAYTGPILNVRTMSLFLQIIQPFPGVLRLFPMVINADLGPDPNVQWVALVHPVGLSIGMTIVGRLGDLFGRRWFFIVGAFLALVGTLVSALAVDLNMLIVGALIKALAASTQLSVYYAMGELLAAKHRYLMIGIMNLWQIPGSVFAPAVANSIVRMAGTWRSVFYLLTAVNGSSMILYFFFYHPPTFHEKHGKRQSKLEFIKAFDYIGTALYAVGLVFFLLGVSWGGAKYPWASAHVISFMIIGGISFISFVCYETLYKPKEPLIPLELWKNKDFLVSSVLCGIGAGIFYAGAIIWPQLVANFYANGNVMHGAYLACLSGAGISIGGSCAGFLAKPLGYQRVQATVSIAIGGGLLAAVSTATPHNQAQTCALFFFATFFVGYNTDIALGNAILAIRDQRTIGAAGGAAASTRTLVAGVCQSVYSSVLANKKSQLIPQHVIPAVLAAGLPKTSVKQLMTALAVGTAKALAAVPGMTPQIQAAAIGANKLALQESYRMVWLVSLAFTGAGIILGLNSPNTKKYLSNKVAATLATGKTRTKPASSAV